jgi:hypothetical protein
VVARFYRSRDLFLKGERKIMEARNRLMNAGMLIALAGGLIVVVAVWEARKVQAIQDSEDRPSDFGFIDLGAGQTARLSVVNLRLNPPPEPDNPPPEPENVSGLTLRVRLAFDIFMQPPPEPDDPAGATLAQSCISRYRFLRRESCDVVLSPGEAASFDYTAPAGAQVAASINAIGNPDTREGDARLTPEPHLAPTLQVREGTRTIFVVPGVAKGFNPQPDPPGVR